MDIPLNPEIARDMEIQALSDTVTACSIYTKYLPEKKIGQRLFKSLGGDNGDSGDVALTGNKSTWSDKCPGARDLSKSLEKNPRTICVTTWDEIIPDKQDLKIFGIAGAQSIPKNASDTRGDPRYFIYIEMANKAADRLLQMIKNEPIVLEKFYQKVLPGFDSDPNENTGLRRIKTDIITLIDPNDAKEGAVQLQLSEKIGVMDK